MGDSRLTVGDWPSRKAMVADGGGARELDSAPDDDDDDEDDDTACRELDDDIGRFLPRAPERRIGGLEWTTPTKTQKGRRVSSSHPRKDRLRREWTNATRPHLKIKIHWSKN